MKNAHFWARSRALPFAALLLVAACGENPVSVPTGAEILSEQGQPAAASNTTQGELARIRILLTDAPADYIGAASVDIGRVSLVPADGGEHVVLSEDGTDGFVDLLDLQGAVTTPIAEADIEPGEFTQIRMIVEAARVTLVDGYTFRDGSVEKDLFVPSGAQSGLKLNLHDDEGESGVTLVPGETALVLDFDVNQSFVLRGNPDTPAGVHGVNFKPAIRVTAMDVAASVSGSIATDVDGLSLEGLTVTATPTDGGTVDGYQTFVGTALTDGDGAYTIHFLVPGTYDVTVAVAEGLGVDPEVRSVMVGEREDVTGVDFDIFELEVTEAPGSLAGTVSTGLDGASVEGLLVSALLDIDGAEAVTTETNSDGTYLFEGLLAGTYMVSVAVGDDQRTEPGVAEVSVAAAEDVTGIDFEILENVTNSIAGTVTTSLDGVSVEGLTVTAMAFGLGTEMITAETDANGEFTLESVPAGTYSVSVAVGDGLTTNPPNRMMIVTPGSAVTGADFDVISAGQ